MKIDQTKPTLKNFIQNPLNNNKSSYHQNQAKIKTNLPKTNLPKTPKNLNSTHKPTNNLNQPAYPIPILHNPSKSKSKSKIQNQLNPTLRQIQNPANAQSSQPSISQGKPISKHQTKNPNQSLALPI